MFFFNRSKDVMIQQYKYELDNKKDTVVKYSSSNPNVIAVSDKGDITTVGIGHADISTEIINGTTTIFDYIAIKVTGPYTLNAKRGVVFENKIMGDFLASANYGNLSINFSSSNSNVATVNPEGVITAVGEGTADISATINDQGSIKSFVFLKVQVSEALPSITLNVNETHTPNLSGIYNFNNTTVSDMYISLKSNNTSIVESYSGTIKAVSAGTANIWVSIFDGMNYIEYPITVTVN